jgi:TolB protein
MKRVFLGVILSLQPLMAGISYDKESKAQETPEEKVVSETKKALVGSDISSVNARLRIEGASFRQFSLYFATTKLLGSSTIQNKIADDIRQIVDRDLLITGGFSPISHSGKSDDDALLKQKGAEGITRLSLTIKPDIISASLEHKNLITGKRSIKSFSAPHKNLRRLAHLISQSIYEEFIGKENLFSLQIAAVKREGASSQIVLLDFDGHGETPITEGSWSKTSPYFSLDGKTILYSVISRQGQGIVEQEIGQKKMQFRTKKPGINLDPRVLPDNSGMLATLSFENNANIYRITRSGSIVGKMTNGLGLNLSPSIRSDGSEFAFVSDRSGTPQIYVQKLIPNAAPTRLTFQGKYNQTPHFSQDGKFIAFTGRDEKKVFDIFLLERDSGRVSRVTENQGRNQEPHFSPSGRFVIFTSERERKVKPDIFISTLNGSHQFRLTDANSDKKSSGYFSPVIRPEQK